MADTPSTSLPEIWKPVAGYEGLYEVSDHGRVRRLPRFQSVRNKWGGLSHRLLAGHILHPTPSGNRGYLALNLWRDGKARMTRVNILVCETFNGARPEGKPLALHCDGDKSNNRAANLRWGDDADNAADREAHGRTTKGERQHSARLTAKTVSAIRKRVAAGESMASLAREIGVNKSSVQAVVHRRSWKHI